ncbi:hypothetical protein Pen01_00860 [Phytomonospora endophytica]|nr:hypothetical protein Pen01_00860 [Phytomonospora endophytica]
MGEGACRRAGRGGDPGSKHAHVSPIAAFVPYCPYCDFGFPDPSGRVGHHPLTVRNPTIKA